MLKRRKSLIIKVLCATMCTSLIQSSPVFAEGSDIKVTTASQIQATVGVVNSEIDTSESDFGFNSSTGTITKYNGSKTSVVIPSTINGISVTSIGYDAFSGCSNLISISIPNSVKSIGDNAFEKCTSITGITIPDSVISIGYDAFQGCSSLTSISIPNSVTSIGEDAFYWCKKAIFSVQSESVKNLLINSGVDAGKILLNGQPQIVSVTSIKLNNTSLSIIKGNASTLTATVDSNGKVTGIAAGTANIICTASDSSKKSATCSVTVTNPVKTDFEFDSKMGKITGYNGYDSKIVIPSTINGVPVTSIGSSAFYRCRNLTSITIPNSIKSIESHAFEGCSSLMNIIIPNSVTSIGDYAFRGCNSLISIAIPNSVTSIEDYVFSECTSLASISIPSSVTSIGYGTFNNCSNLTSIVIPSTVKSIGVAAFEDCSSLKSITIPNSMTSIGDSTFNGCSSLTKIVIPGNVTSIGNNAFKDCSSLTSISITGGVTKIGKNAFSNCTNLKSINVDSKNSNYASVDGVLFNKLKTQIIQYPKGRTNKSYIIPSNVKSIGEKAFQECDNLTSILIPNSVISVGNSAFYGCSGLTSITIPNSVVSIGSDAFNKCSSLTKLTISSGVKSIGSSAFEECSKLTSINIPNSVTNIGSDAFYKCSNLTSVTVPNGVSSMGRYAFSGKNTLFYVESEKTKKLLINSGVNSSQIILNGQSSIVKATGVKLNATSLNLTAGKSGKFTATIAPTNTTNKGLIWTTSNSKVATIDQSGNIKAVGAGTAVITAKTTDGSNKSATCTVNVTKASIVNVTKISTVKATSIKLNTTSLNWSVGKSGKLTATIAPTNTTNKGLTWTTSNSKVATIDQSGNIKAVGAGTAVITVKTANGSNKSTTCTVKVTK